MTARTPEERAREIVGDILDGLPWWKMIDDKIDADVANGVEATLVAAFAKALSADPVAEAAIRVADVVLAKESEIMTDPFAVFDRGPFGERVIAALAAYRQAREGRGK